MRLHKITNTNLGSLGIFHPTTTENELRQIVIDPAHLAIDSKVLLTGTQDIKMNHNNILRTHWDDLADQDIINIINSLRNSKKEIENIKDQLKL